MKTRNIVDFEERVLEIAQGGKTPKNISASTYTILEDDFNHILQFTNATGCAVTIPKDLPIERRYEGKQRGDGSITFVAATDVTLNVVGSEEAYTNEKFSVFAFDCVALNEYDLYGRLKSNAGGGGGTGVTTYTALTDKSTVDLPSINIPLKEALDTKVNKRELKEIPSNTYTLQDEDKDKTLVFTDVDGCMLHVPEDLSIENEYEGIQLGNSQVEIGGSLPVVINPTGDCLPKTADKYSPFGLKATSNNKYVLYGRLESTSGSGGTPYTLPTASATIKGGIKVGANLSMTGDTLNATGGGTGVTTYAALTDKASVDLPTVNSPLSVALGLKANDSTVVKLTGTQIVSGGKTFTTVPKSTQDGVASTDLVRKSQLDTKLDNVDIGPVRIFNQDPLTIVEAEGTTWKTILGTTKINLTKEQCAAGKSYSFKIYGTMDTLTSTIGERRFRVVLTAGGSTETQEGVFITAVDTSCKVDINGIFDFGGTVTNTGLGFYGSGIVLKLDGLAPIGFIDATGSAFNVTSGITLDFQFKGAFTNDKFKTRKVQVLDVNNKVILTV